MIPVEQREMADIEAGTTGDCWKCCIASILELPYEDVPHFVSMEEHGEIESYWNSTIEFLKPRGFCIAYIALHGKSTPMLKFGNEEIKYHFHLPGHWIASVVSPRFIEKDGTPGSHVVVMSGYDIVFDPHPQRDMGHLGFTGAYPLVKS